MSFSLGNWRTGIILLKTWILQQSSPDHQAVTLDYPLVLYTHANSLNYLFTQMLSDYGSCQVTPDNTPFFGTEGILGYDDLWLVAIQGYLSPTVAPPAAYRKLTTTAWLQQCPCLPLLAPDI